MKNHAIMLTSQSWLSLGFSGVICDLEDVLVMFNPFFCLLKTESEM